MSRIIKKIDREKQILKKHVSAIHAVADLSALQRKLVNALLYNAYDNLLTDRDHKINTRILCDMIGFDSKNISYLKEALVGIVETVMQFDIMEDDGEQSWEAMSLLTYVKVKGGVCTYRYEQSLAEKLFHPDVYSKINLSVLRNLRSSHALVLYENCLRYIGIGHTPVWDLELFRKLMAVEGRYKEFKFLKRDVILPAMKEVNKHSNINVELLTVRKGRSVSALQFGVKSNPQLGLLGMEDEDDVSSSKAYEVLLNQGISKTLARSWVIDYGETYILEKVEFANVQATEGKIKSSKTGFLKSAIEENYQDGKALIQKEKQKKIKIAETIKTKTEQEQRKLENLKKTKRDIENSYRRYCVEKIEEAFECLSKTEQEAIRAEFKQALKSHIYVDAFNKSGWKDRLNAPAIREFWKMRDTPLPSLAEWIESSNLPNFDTINKKIENIEQQHNV